MPTDARPMRRAPTSRTCAHVTCVPPPLGTPWPLAGSNSSRRARTGVGSQMTFVRNAWPKLVLKAPRALPDRLLSSLDRGLFRWPHIGQKRLVTGRRETGPGVRRRSVSGGRRPALLSKGRKRHSAARRRGTDQAALPCAGHSARGCTIARHPLAGRTQPGYRRKKRRSGCVNVCRSATGSICRRHRAE